MLQMTQTSQPAESVTILGIRVDRCSQRQALAYMQELIARKKAGQDSVACQQVVTVNVEFVMAAQQNVQFRDYINHAALVVPDSIGIVLAARFLGKPVPERVTGTDMMPELARLCARQGYRLYLLGAAPGVAEDAARRLQEIAPGLQIAGMYAGTPAPDEEDAIIERIRTAEADVLCVAYGAPTQDVWIGRNLSRLPVAAAMGVGGAFDFLSGRQVRAPRWMQKSGLEWLYRLYREPWRWRRMLALPRFAFQVLVKGRADS
ncbi:MAG TPA: WecB/TagA/CpsF family glycosyltransferase [Ktedonobacteraceae bacterium]|jgi:N-acetylglucosaminyldiphosphoundecaprenol N-acetyl-beta-D-mannosaminyltransferase